MALTNHVCFFIGHFNLYLATFQLFVYGKYVLAWIFLLLLFYLFLQPSSVGIELLDDFNCYQLDNYDARVSK